MLTNQTTQGYANTNYLQNIQRHAKQNPNNLFYGNALILTCIKKCKGLTIAKTNLVKDEITQLAFKTHYKSTLTKTVWYWYKLDI